MNSINTSSGYAIFDVFPKEFRNGESIERLSQFVNDAYWEYRKEYISPGPFMIRTSTEEIEDLIDHKQKKLFVAVCKTTNVIAGTILYEPLDEISASFGLFAVEPEHRKNNLGSHMVSYLEAYALNQGIEQIKIKVLGFGGRLIKYYESLKYHKTEVKYKFTDLSQAKLNPQYENSAEAYYFEMKKNILES